jgi:hypothetical protein
MNKRQIPALILELQRARADVGAALNDMDGRSLNAKRLKRATRSLNIAIQKLSDEWKA